MTLLLLCILVNTWVNIVFKIFDRYGINNAQAITINYFVCVVTAGFVLGNFPIPFDIWTKTWFPYAFLLGIVFIIMFNLLAFTIQKLGIVIPVIFIKMSLLVPVFIGILYYNEANNLYKTVGILSAVIAIICLSYQKSGLVSPNTAKWWYLPFALWIGGGIIEGLLYVIDQEQIAVQGDIQFVASTFFFAGMNGLILLIYRSFSQRTNFAVKNLVAGVALGIPNFFSIYLLLLLLSGGWDGSVLFPVNNVAVLALSALVGFLIFREKVTLNKGLGFSLAILAILLIMNA